MECNNKHCLWNYGDSCCHEDYEKAEKIATPNQLDCPASLRKDFDIQLFKLAKECDELISRRTMRELIEIKKFLLSQREEK